MAIILLVEDNKMLCRTLQYNLEADGHTIYAARDLKSADEVLSRIVPELMVLDVNLPDGNGFEFYQSLNENKRPATFFLTASDMESDILKGYELGADDYITKPFSMAVFLKQVGAFLRRTHTDSKKENLYDDGFLSIDFSKFEVTLHNEVISMTAFEFKLLKIFVSNPLMILTHEQLIDFVWDDFWNGDELRLRKLISRIRSKIEKKGRQYIRSVYGMGYIWEGKNNEH